MKPLLTMPYRIDAQYFARRYQAPPAPAATAPSTHESNPLQEYFDHHTEGHGIWKWNHYFEIYHRHFAKFRRQPVNLLEIGIYSGGSLEMWRTYFGDQCHIYGIDIEDACRAYANDTTTVFIGDQANRQFWRDFRSNTPPMDIIIDDGGHTPKQQKVTLEETLPALRNGGVYLCEDIHGRSNRFAAYASGLIEELNHFGDQSAVQKSIHSIHCYPFCLVIEKHAAEPAPFHAPKRGATWQPFFD